MFELEKWLSQNLHAEVSSCVERVLARESWFTEEAFVGNSPPPTTMAGAVHKGHAQGEHEYDGEQQGGTNLGPSIEVLCLGGLAAVRVAGLPLPLSRRVPLPSASGSPGFAPF